MTSIIAAFSVELFTDLIIGGYGSFCLKIATGPDWLGDFGDLPIFKTVVMNCSQSQLH